MLMLHLETNLDLKKDLGYLCFGLLLIYFYIQSLGLVSTHSSLDLSWCHLDCNTTPTSSDEKQCAVSSSTTCLSS